VTWQAAVPAAVAAGEDGAQARRPAGAWGTTLAQVARPDRQMRHEPGCCIIYLYLGQ